MCVCDLQDSWWKSGPHGVVWYSGDPWGLGARRLYIPEWPGRVFSQHARQRVRVLLNSAWLVSITKLKDNVALAKQERAARTESADFPGACRPWRGRRETRVEDLDETQAEGETFCVSKTESQSAREGDQTFYQNTGRIIHRGKNFFHQVRSMSLLICASSTFQKSTSQVTGGRKTQEKQK